MISERDYLAFAMSNLPESRAHAPDLVEEVEGIVAGAGQPFERVWLLNNFDESAWAPWEWDVKRLVTSIVIAGQCRSTNDGL